MYGASRLRRGYRDIALTYVLGAQVGVKEDVTGDESFVHERGSGAFLELVGAGQGKPGNVRKKNTR